MNKSKSFHQQRQAARARRKASKRRMCDHEHVPYAEIIPVLDSAAPSQPSHSFPAHPRGKHPLPALGLTVIAPHVNRKAGRDNRNRTE